MVKWGMVGQVLGHQFEAGQVQQSKWAKRFEWWSDVWKKHEETLWRLNQNDRNKNTRFWDYAPQDRKNTWQVSLQLCVCVCVCVSVCVSHPGQRVFPSPSLHFTPQAGACSICGPLHATKLRPQMGRDQGRLILYLQNNTLTPMVHPAAVRCFHGSSCLHPPNRFLLAAEPPIARRCAAFVQQSEGNYVKQFK